MDRLVFIPKRDSLQLHRARGHKPPSSATEVSIPKRDSRAAKVFSLLPSNVYDTG